jgi:hypothetical protein
MQATLLTACLCRKKSLYSMALRLVRDKVRPKSRQLLQRGEAPRMDQSHVVNLCNVIEKMGANGQDISAKLWSR